ncbi:MAG: MXAN_5187 C-terminal domain-containing protein [bacterium]
MADNINDDLLADLEQRIERLRADYDQYFMGQRKRAPLQEKTSVQYYIRRLSNQKITNTRLNFKFQQLVAKFNSYNQKWERQMQAMEQGTMRRGRPTGKAAAAASPPPGQASAQNRKSGEDGGIDKLYQDYIEARKSLNQNTNVSKEKMAESIKKQMPKLKEKHQGKDVKFKVVVENGEAKLKATVK